MTATKKLKADLTRKRKFENVPPPEDYLSSGSTLFNLGITGSIKRAFAKGFYYFFVGDSSSGKTWLLIQALAEACRNAHFAKYRLIHNNPENGALMDIGRYFGSLLKKRLETRADETVEDFYDHLEDLIAAGQPFIEILDSMDALETLSQRKARKKQRNARKTNAADAGPGTFGVEKAKINSQRLGTIIAGLKRVGGILFIVCQTRDNIGFGSQFEPKTRAGGKALKFYTTVEIWTAIKERLKSKPVNGKQRKIGIICGIRLKKNRITGKDRDVEIPIYEATGADDVGGNVRFLIAEKYWKSGGEKSTTVSAPEFEHDGSIEKLIQKIENEGRERELQILVKSVWDDIEAAVAVKRKPRYE